MVMYDTGQMLTGKLFVLQHKHNADNNWETPFDFTDENYEIVSVMHGYMFSKRTHSCKYLMLAHSMQCKG